MRLGEFIREYRTKNHLSYRDFAAISGLSHGYIEKLEKCDPRTGKFLRPTFETYEVVARATNMTILELVQIISSEEDGAFEKTPDNLEDARNHLNEYMTLAKVVKQSGVPPQAVEDFIRLAQRLMKEAKPN